MGTLSKGLASTSSRSAEVDEVASLRKDNVEGAGRNFIHPVERICYYLAHFSPPLRFLQCGASGGSVVTLRAMPNLVPGVTGRSSKAPEMPKEN